MVDTPTILPSSIPGVGLQHTARFGTSAVAMRHFTAGSLIMAEVPLLCTASLVVPDAAVERLKAKLPNLPGTTPLYQMMAFCQADTEVQRQVLDCIYSPEPAEVAGTPILDIAAKVAAAVAEDAQLVHALGAASASEAEATALKVMMAWQSGACEFDQVRSALFEVGHKMAHTCGTPNTVYRSFAADDLSVPEEVRGKGCHVARRDIAAGELLTTTYWSPKLVMPSAVARKHLLRQSFGFMCECDHCRSGWDRHRGLPCPVCSGDVRDSRGMIALDVAMGQVAPKGVVWCDLAKAAAGDPAPWACDACGARLKDDERLLLGPLADEMLAHGNGEFKSLEVQLFSLAQVWDAELVAQPTISITDMAEKWAMVVGIVGPAHWATYHMYGLLAELHAGELFGCSLGLGKSKGVEEVVKDMRWHLEELQDDFDKIWRWLVRTNSTPLEAAEAACLHFGCAANQVLEAAETKLTGGGAASGSSSRHSVLRVQHQLAQLAGVLLRRIGCQVTREWHLPHELVHDWDALMLRCEHVLALPVMALPDAIRLERGARLMAAPPGQARTSTPSRATERPAPSAAPKMVKKAARRGRW